jgi:starch-binding outer membrane protein SusE/F
MKRILKTIFFAICLIAFVSCEDDIDPKVSTQGFVLRAVDSASPLVLTPQNNANNVVTLQWDKSDNGGFSAVSTYIVEVAESGTNFAGAVSANAGNNITTADRSYILTVGELNTLINSLPGYQCGQPMDVDIRVKSTLGAGMYNQFVQYSSNVVTVNVTPYSSALPTLAFSATGTIAADTPKLAASSVLNTDYEGYMWLTPGSYKFYQPTSCGDFGSPVVFGDDDSGSFNTLTPNGSGYTVLVAGYYLVKANLSTAGPLAMTYSVRPTTWNLFGAAKQFFPQANSAMTYDQASGLWKVTITLAEGYEFRFRSNSNTFILGKFKDTSVNPSEYAGPILSYNGTDLNVPGAKSSPRTYKSYLVALDLSRPRDYSYTITENP